MSKIYCDICGNEHGGDIQTCKQCLEDLKGCVELKSKEFNIEVDEFDKNKFIKEESKYIRAHGGDGTLLKAISKYKYLGKPFFGTAAGTLNFLMNREQEISPTAKYKKFNLIRATITYDSLERDLSSIGDHYVERTKEFEAFNEVSIGGDMNFWGEFNVHDKDRIIGKFNGGGVIFSTAQGSTGVNKNNHGFILPLASKNWCVTGDKTTRRIGYVIRPERTTITVSSRTPLKVWVDGSHNVIDNVKQIILTKGSVVKVIFNDYVEFKKKRRV